MIFFRCFPNFWKPRSSENVRVVFASRFDPLSRNFLSVMHTLFAKTYPNFVTLDRFFKTKIKISTTGKKCETNSHVFEQIDKSIWAEKSYVTGFILNNVLQTNFLISFWNYWYVTSMFLPPSECLIFFIFLSNQ